MELDWIEPEDPRDEHRPCATEAEAHYEWHINAGVPLHTGCCPWDCCGPDEPEPPEESYWEHEMLEPEPDPEPEFSHDGEGAFYGSYADFEPVYDPADLPF
jgi:hypothetical protein